MMVFPNDVLLNKQSYTECTIYMIHEKQIELETKHRHHKQGLLGFFINHVQSSNIIGALILLCRFITNVSMHDNIHFVPS